MPDPNQPKQADETPLPRRPSARTAFVHVDLDDFWAIAECYGFTATAGSAHAIYEQALEKFATIFAEFEVRATFFVVGRDAEFEPNHHRLRQLLQAGHLLGNHSHSHRLDFRALSQKQIEEEVEHAENAIAHVSGSAPRSFRAPGYGVSPALVSVLERRHYVYDSSLMPSPYGFVFRYLDGRMRRMVERQIGPQQRERGPFRSSGRKTQYALFGDRHAPLMPYRVSAESMVANDPAASLLELPVAAAPLLRLPFQIGVCMRLGRWYFDTLLASFERTHSELPITILLHGADLVDFQRIDSGPLSGSAFFAQPIERKLDFVRYCLEKVTRDCRVETAEEWMAQLQR